MNHRKLAASFAASLLTSSAMAASLPDASQARIATDYSAWAGGRDNAEALVSGLHRGTSITLSTQGTGNAVSLAGFTPHGPMSYADVNAALARAREDLVRLGVRQPTAEQIQAALIGGDVRLSNGRTRALRGTVAVLGGSNLATR